MDNALGAAVIGIGVAGGSLGLVIALVACFLGFFALIAFWFFESARPIRLSRFNENPVLKPVPEHWWESEAVFNPAAIVAGGRVHVLYRALGRDGISRIGYASSADGIHFDQRSAEPVYSAENYQEARSHHPFTSPARLTYDTVSYGSGGGWGGCEDPRAVVIEGRVYMTFNMFNGWDTMRVAFTSTDEYNLLHARGLWSHFDYLSRPNERQKNWVLFPEKIGGKFALFHNLDMGDPARVHIKFMDTLSMTEAPTAKEAPDPQRLPDHTVAWHYRTRSAASPPIKTSEGWLLLYHAMDKNDPNRYKLGAMLLDRDDPTKVLYRAVQPILAPDAWYENDWKPGIIYVSGAVVLGKDLIVYYGGGDKYVAAAKTDLRDFLRKLKNHEQAKLKPVKM
ncbi:MAG TPA: hypothetical protein VHD55_03070 [Candidatus Paceibacterota bacterium]|nr:hypothetical protein [Candidatus Paceibacterota bacterium]